MGVEANTIIQSEEIVEIHRGEWEGRPVKEVLTGPVKVIHSLSPLPTHTHTHHTLSRLTSNWKAFSANVPHGHSCKAYDG